MNKLEIEENIEEIQSKMSNLKIAIAVPMGILMLLYFFSFAALIDRGMMVMLYVEIFSSICFILAFVYLNPLGYRITKWRFRNNKKYNAILRIVGADEIDRDSSELSDIVMRSRGYSKII